MEKGIAIITGADGGMGREITLALAKEGFQIIMACKEPDKARTVCDKIKKESGNERIEIRQIDLSSLASVRLFADKLLAEGRPVSRLMNNAGCIRDRCWSPDDKYPPDSGRPGNDRKC